MNRLKFLAILALVVAAGCSANRPAPGPQALASSPEYVGRGCVATAQPDGTPEFSTGCTGGERLMIERHFYR